MGKIFISLISIKYYMYFRYIIIQYMLTKCVSATHMSYLVNGTMITNVKTKNANPFIINAVYTGNLITRVGFTLSVLVKIIHIILSSVMFALGGSQTIRMKTIQCFNGSVGEIQS